MSERQAFLRAIRANPDDDTARLAFADWLDEHNEPEHAEFIRVQIELEPVRFRIDNPRAVELHAREDALLRQHGSDWLGTEHLLTNPADFGPVFRRGLPDYACLSLDTFLQNGAALFDAHLTLREVALYGVANRCDELTLSPLLAKLDTLEIADFLTDNDEEALGVSPHLRDIANFKLWIGGETYEFLRKIVMQADANWPHGIELVQVYGGAACHDAYSAHQLSTSADLLANYANTRLGRDIARVSRPFERLLPLWGDMGYHLRAGYLPCGAPALAAGSFQQWILVAFTEDGRIRDVEVRDSSAFAGADSVELDAAFQKWLDKERQLEPGLIQVREFEVENLSVVLWGLDHTERFASPHPVPVGNWNEEDWRNLCGEARGWLERRDFVINWGNDYWADWRGIIHSS